MRFSCCVFDLDGTLLTSKNTISNVDLSTLQKLSKDGVKIIIATGRSILQIKEYISALGIADPVITCNGACISNALTGEIIHKSFLRKKDAESMMKQFNSDGTDYLFYTPDFVYHSNSSNRINLFKTYNATAKEEFHVPIRSINSYPATDDYSNIHKFLVYDNVSKLSAISERFNVSDTLTIVSSGKNLIDIMPQNSTKGNAIKLLTKHLGIPLSEVIVFGDSPNDETMFKVAGFSVAMGNADNSIKKIADFVTRSNDDFGITHAIKHIKSI